MKLEIIPLFNAGENLKLTGDIMEINGYKISYAPITGEFMADHPIVGPYFFEFIELAIDYAERG